jgi:hypothetical protein
VKTTRFFAGLLLITALLGLIAMVVYRNLFPLRYPVIFPYMLGFFFLVNSLFYLTFNRIYKTGNNRFVRQFMMLFGVKLFIYLVAIVVVLPLFKSQALNIALSAMILYLVYTGYEVIWLTSLVKRKEQSQ